MKLIKTNFIQGWQVHGSQCHCLVALVQPLRPGEFQRLFETERTALKSQAMIPAELWKHESPGRVNQGRAKAWEAGGKAGFLARGQAAEEQGLRGCHEVGCGDRCPLLPPGQDVAREQLQPRGRAQGASYHMRQSRSVSESAPKWTVVT